MHILGDIIEGFKKLINFGLLYLLSRIIVSINLKEYNINHKAPYGLCRSKGDSGSIIWYRFYMT